MKKQAIRWALVAIWLLLTVYLSQQNAAESAATSGWLAQKIYALIRLIGINVSYRGFHMLIRKMAHFGVHFVLAWLGYRALLATCNKRLNAIIVTFLFFGSIAILDEAIQSVAPGRAMMAFDAFINLCGITAGTIVGIAKTRR